MECCQRDDITLLLRNFNFQLFVPISPSGTLRNSQASLNPNNSESLKLGWKFNSLLNTLSSNANETLTEASIASSDSSEQLKSTRSQNLSSLEEDPNERIPPYVDFTSFYEAVQKAKDRGTIPKDAKY